MAKIRCSCRTEEIIINFYRIIFTNYVSLTKKQEYGRLYYPCTTRLRSFFSVQKMKQIGIISSFCRIFLFNYVSQKSKNCRPKHVARIFFCKVDLQNGRNSNQMYKIVFHKICTLSKKTSFTYLYITLQKSWPKTVSNAEWKI